MSQEENNPLGIRQVSADEYKSALTAARNERPHVKEATTDPEHMPGDEGSNFYLSHDGRSGFGVTHKGIGIGLFSLEKGRGLDLLKHQINHGGMTWADHFGGVPDHNGNPTPGYLDRLYESLGPGVMTEFGRQPNWTPGGPDVVYRVIRQNMDKYPDNPYEEDGVHYPGTLEKQAAMERKTPPGQAHGSPFADEDDARQTLANMEKGI